MQMNHFQNITYVLNISFKITTRKYYSYNTAMSNVQAIGVNKVYSIVFIQSYIH